MATSTRNCRVAHPRVNDRIYCPTTNLLLMVFDAIVFKNALPLRAVTFQSHFTLQHWVFSPFQLMVLERWIRLSRLKALWIPISSTRMKTPTKRKTTFRARTSGPDVAPWTSKSGLSQLRRSRRIRYGLLGEIEPRSC